MKALLLRKLSRNGTSPVTATAAALWLGHWVARQKPSSLLDSPQSQQELAIVVGLIALSLSGLIVRTGTLLLIVAMAAIRSIGAFVLESVRMFRKSLRLFFGMWLADRAAKRGWLSAWDRSNILRRLVYQHAIGEEPPVSMSVLGPGVRTAPLNVGASSTSRTAPPFTDATGN